MWSSSNTIRYSVGFVFAGVVGGALGVGGAESRPSAPVLSSASG